jgi:hypothetical protein
MKNLKDFWDPPWFQLLEWPVNMGFFVFFCLFLKKLGKNHLVCIMVDFCKIINSENLKTRCKNIKLKQMCIGIGHFINWLRSEQEGYDPMHH